MANLAANGLPEESVWDYPRPPRVEPLPRRVRVELAEASVADSSTALRVLETASPPTVYVPEVDVRMELLREAAHSQSICEWKGAASYFDVAAGGRFARAAAWTYRHPNVPFSILRGHFAFYAGLLECYLDEERVVPQRGSFYGGWLTAEIVGPFKGSPGTEGW